jgi:hypothetical protein
MKPEHHLRYLISVERAARKVHGLAGAVLHVPDHCGVDLSLKREIDELLRHALAQLDMKSRDELCDLRDRIEDERRRGGTGEADLQWRHLLALELLGHPTPPLPASLSKVGELRQRRRSR